MKQFLELRTTHRKTLQDIRCAGMLSSSIAAHIRESH